MHRLLLCLLHVLMAAPVAAGVEVRAGSSGRMLFTNDGAVGARAEAGSEGAARFRARAPSRQAQLSPVIEAAARRHELDPRLVEAVIRAESAFDPLAVSRAGAMGLMQIMPATARDLALEAPFEPAANVTAGAAYLRRMLDLFGGRFDLALAAYNAGPSRVTAYGGVPPYPETVSYVRRVLGEWLGDAAPEVVPSRRAVRSTGAALAAPVRWRSEGGRPHLTNVR